LALLCLSLAVPTHLVQQVGVGPHALQQCPALSPWAVLEAVMFWLWSWCCLRSSQPHIHPPCHGAKGSCCIVSGSPMSAGPDPGSWTATSRPWVPLPLSSPSLSSSDSSLCTPIVSRSLTH
jgi:hypothetical protein